MKIALAIVCLLCSLTAWGQEQGKSALDDLIRAAEQGYADAQFNLGVAYANGQGVPQDYGEAHMWLNLAASRASRTDAKSYAEVRDDLAGKMTPQQIAEAQRLVREWKPKTWDELKDQ
jgi:TPR repeat protein